jgi:hypothetical protein
MLALLIPLQTVRAAVLINEMLPKTEDATQSYIELYNTGDDSVSLNQWKLTETQRQNQFVLNASWIIPGHGYLALFKEKTGIVFDMAGDTLILTNERGEEVDSKSYLGTLGFYMSIGRSPDGGDGWTVCISATPGEKNNCPPTTPTPTETPVPTATEEVTPPEETTEAPPPRPAVEGAQTTQPQLIVVAATPTPTPTPGDALTISIPTTIVVSRRLAAQALFVIAAWALLAMVARSRRKKKVRHTKTAPPPS